MEPAEDWPGSVNQARQEERTHQGGHGVKAGAEFPAAEARMLNPQCCDRDTPPSQRRLVIALSPRSNDTPTDGSASGQRALPRRRLLRDRSSTPEQAVVSSGGRTRSRSSGGRTRSRSRCRLSEGASTPARASPRTSAVKSPATPVGAYARQILKSRGSARTLLKGVNIASFLARIHDGGPS